MSEISIRTEGRAGRITLQRPKALNALTYAMCLDIEAALDRWATDDAVALVLIDAEGDKAFCAGGDIAEMYATGTAGDFDYGRRFWFDEYRLNAKLSAYPKPVVSFLQGFTMGGGVGVGCHGSHRVVGETSQIAMPECGIGLVPDVGGSLLLARAPGHTGRYLGLTGARMGPGDAIFAGFADHFVPHWDWPRLIVALETTGDATLVEKAAHPAPDGPVAAARTEIDRLFAADTLAGIVASLEADTGDLAQSALKSLSRNAPLSLGCALEMNRRLKGSDDMRAALQLEYRFTYRAMEHGDFLEGIRAQIIDKDRRPRWRHDLRALPDAAVEAMLAPLDAPLTFERKD